MKQLQITLRGALCTWQVKDRELQELKLSSAMRAEEEAQLKRLRAHNEGLNGMVPAGQARDLQLQIQV